MVPTQAWLKILLTAIATVLAIYTVGYGIASYRYVAKYQALAEKYRKPS